MGAGWGISASMTNEEADMQKKIWQISTMVLGVILWGICIWLTACTNAEYAGSEAIISGNGNPENTNVESTIQDIGIQIIARTNVQRVVNLTEQLAVSVAKAVLREADNKPEFWDFTRQNENFFNRAVEKLGLSEAEAAECLQILCGDDVFQGGKGQLTAFLAGDFDGNGQRDMAVMIHQYPYCCYGTGCIYIYMNEDEPYCFLDDEFPFCSAEFNEMHISGGDLDNDGIIEILVEASGTGNGGAGDWQGRILKYKDHSMEKTEMLPEGEIEFEIQVIQEVEENAYRAYFPGKDETIAFEAKECFHDAKEARLVGSNVRGLFDMHCVEYQGGYALEGSEYLSGEGGNAHIVALVKFILVWDGNGDWDVAQWWLEP